MSGITDSELWLLNNGAHNLVMKFRKSDLDPVYFSDALSMYADKKCKEIESAWQDAELRAEKAEARVRELEFKLHLLSEKTKSKIMEKMQ